MKLILTAEEMIVKMFKTKASFYNQTDVKETMIEFAKLHCEAQAKEILENIPCLGSSTDIASAEEIEKAVLNTYPLSNIK